MFVKMFSEIRRIFQCDNIGMAERLNTVEAMFSINFQNLPSVEDINLICALVPTRDALTLIFKNDSDDIVSVTNKQTVELDFSPITEGLDQSDNIDIKIQIDKTVFENKFSIYDFDSFTQDLLQRPLIEIMNWFSECLKAQENLMFEVFDYDISLSTRTIAFESSDKVTFKSKINRIQRLNDCKEVSYFYNMNVVEVIPDDFIIEGIVRSGECLKPLFGKLATILSLVYVASSASINDTTVNVQISGQRTTSHELKLNDIHEDETWISIYSWIFTDGNPIDKALIAHNVISLHCKYETLLSLDIIVFDSIKTNYNLYLRNNVNQYLDMKRDIAKFIQNIVTQVGDYALSILGKFKTNLLAIFGFLFTVVLTKIGGTQKWDDIFTRHTVYLIELFVSGSLVYLAICISETHYKLKKTKKGYNELKNNYEDIMSSAELKEAFKDDKLLSDAEKSTKRGMVTWSIIWGSLLVFSILIIEVFTINHGLIVWLWNKVFP